MSETQQFDEPSSPPRSEFMKVMDRPWAIILLLLHVGFLGIPIYWKTNYSVATRLWIILASIVYTVGAVVFIWLMLRWIMHVLGTLSG
jgi:hypothetical protein